MIWRNIPGSRNRSTNFSALPLESPEDLHFPEWTSAFENMRHREEIAPAYLPKALDITTHPEPHSAAVTLGRSPAVRPAAHRALAARDRLLAGYPLWEAWRRQARASQNRGRGPAG